MRIEKKKVTHIENKVIDVCCSIMESAIRHEKIEYDLDGKFNIYDGAEINYCPWCGKKIEVIKNEN